MNIYETTADCFDQAFSNQVAAELNSKLKREQLVLVEVHYAERNMFFDVEHAMPQLRGTSEYTDKEATFLGLAGKVTVNDKGMVLFERGKYTRLGQADENTSKEYDLTSRGINLEDDFVIGKSALSALRKGELKVVECSTEEELAIKRCSLGSINESAPRIHSIVIFTAKDHLIYDHVVETEKPVDALTAFGRLNLSLSPRLEERIQNDIKDTVIRIQARLFGGESDIARKIADIKVYEERARGVFHKDVSLGGGFYVKVPEFVAELERGISERKQRHAKRLSTQ